MRPWPVELAYWQPDGRTDTMSTHDVPGHKPEHHDQLAMGCWAEHEDGSLIFIEAVEGGKVVYEMFDLSADPPMSYRDAMVESRFKQQFSYPNVLDDRWTWHDKTPFPWDLVMETIPGGTRHPTADHQISAAARVAKHLDLRARRLRRERFEHLRSRAGKTARSVRDRLQRAIGELTR